ncbi:MAG: glycosyltransferase family 2 protein [Verrucomicrobiales bacterium]|nr:glycosyltransferase family 2 protein [Verrucomicrobiales bacterium]
MSLLPKVSFLIPTLNAAGILETCLQSIRKQDYPADRMEIIVADGGSSDGTRALAARYGANILDNPRRGYDSGKCVALAGASGEFVVFVDADNEITHTDFITRAVAAMQRYPDALGLESYYLPSPRMSSICVYLSQVLHISDPVAWMMSVNPRLVAAVDGVERWTFPDGRLAFPMGANGFIFRRADLAHLTADDLFEDCTVVIELARRGRTEWLRLPGRGVHHYVVGGWWDFVRKRRRQTFHFLAQRHQKKVSWTQFQPTVPGWLACLYCGTLIGPLYHTLRGLVRTGNPAWLWHSVVSFSSVLGISWGVLTYWFRGRDQSAEAALQPKQQLK